MNKKSYISKLLKKYPKIASGRKNFKEFEKRIQRNIELTRVYSKKNK